MNAYAVVGPTKRHPRRFKSFARAVDAVVVAGSSLGGPLVGGSNDQKY